MSWKSLFVCTLACLAVGNNPHYDISSKSPDLDGEWRLTIIEFQGTRWQLAGDASPRWIIHGNRLTIRASSGSEETIAVRWDAQGKRGSMDWTDGDIVKMRGIYFQTADRLLICAGPDSRPTDLKPRPDSEERCFVLERRPSRTQP
jgi:uncharacterized protein (TIGR03067 family)